MEFGELSTPAFWTPLLVAVGYILKRLVGGQPLFSVTNNHITVNGDNNTINCPPDQRSEAPQKRLTPDKERDDGGN